MSVSANTMLGDLPPSSSESRLSVLDASRMICLPTSVARRRRPPRGRDRGVDVALVSFGHRRDRSSLAGLIDWYVSPDSGACHCPATKSSPAFMMASCSMMVLARASLLCRQECSQRGQVPGSRRASQA